MFMIHTPQTIALLTPADDAAESEHHGTITFDHEGDDVSKCRMVITRDDKVFTYTFNTRGNLVSSAYEDDATRREAKAAHDENEWETGPANQAVM